MLKYAAFLFLFLIATIFVRGEPQHLSLDHPIEIEMAKNLHNQQVIVRGFLYQNSENKWILAHQPNLKSCCIGKEALMSQQIFVEGSMSPTLQAVTLQGRFQVNPTFNQNGNFKEMYFLDQAIVVSSDYSYGIYLLILLMCAGFFLFFKLV